MKIKMKINTHYLLKNNYYIESKRKVYNNKIRIMKK